MGVLIGDLPARAAVDGAESLPVYESGATQKVTAEQLRAFVLSALTGADSATSADGCVFFASLAGALKRVAVGVLVSAVEAARAVDASDANLNTAKLDGSAGRAYIEAVVAARLQAVLSALFGVDAAAVATLAGAQVLVLQGGSVCRAGLDGVSAKILSGIGAFLVGLNDAALTAGHYFLVADSSGGVKRAKVQDVLDLSGTVIATGCEENRIPQWDSGDKRLKKGLAVTETVGEAASASEVPTALAVKNAIAAATGVSPVQSIDGSSTDAQVPSAKAVNDFVAAKTAEMNTSIAAAQAAAQAAQTAADTATTASTTASSNATAAQADAAQAKTDAAAAVTAAANALTLADSTGKKWKITVSTDGTLSAVAV